MQTVVLSFDPSLSSTGYAVKVFPGLVVDAGKIITNPKHSEQDRLKVIWTGILTLITKWQPTVIFCESQFSHLNPKTLMILSHVRGVVMLAAGVNEINFNLFTPSEIKKKVTGSGKASKDMIYQVMKSKYMTNQLVSALLASDKVIETGKNKNDDIADALAILEMYDFYEQQTA